MEQVPVDQVYHRLEERFISIFDIFPHRHAIQPPADEKQEKDKKETEQYFLPAGPWPGYGVGEGCHANTLIVILRWEEKVQMLHVMLLAGELFHELQVAEYRNAFDTDESL
jgi:hypothetical protein